jgi:hypothetical protein
VWVYRIARNGIALHITLQGTKYYEDDELNKKWVWMTKRHHDRRIRVP